MTTNKLTKSFLVVSTSYPEEIPGVFAYTVTQLLDRGRVLESYAKFWEENGDPVTDKGSVTDKDLENYLSEFVLPYGDTFSAGNVLSDSPTSLRSYKNAEDLKANLPFAVLVIDSNPDNLKGLNDRVFFGLAKVCIKETSLRETNINITKLY